MLSLRSVLITVLLLPACSSVSDVEPSDGKDAGVHDAGVHDAGVHDAGVHDAGAPDAGAPDAGPAPPLAVPEAKYHSFEEIEAYLQMFADRHPDHVLLDRYGESTAGRPLYVVKISDNVEKDEDEPELLINFTIHGNEIIVAEAGLMLLYNLAERYAWDARIKTVVDTHELYVVPVVSPDSFVTRSRRVDGVNPNRDFPHPGRPDHKSIGIVTAARMLFEAHDFVGSLDYHAMTGGGFILLPYGGSFERPPSYQELKAVGDVMAVQGYRAIQISQWLGFTTAGCSADYSYWKSDGGVTLGVELGPSARPGVGLIRSMTDDAVEMTLRFAEQF